MTIRNLFLATAVWMLLAGTASAQTRAEGAVGGGLGGWFNTFGASGPLAGAAGGGEWRITPRIGAGGEVEVFGGWGSIMLAVTAQGGARLAPPSHALVPFVAGGYTRVTFFELSDTAFSVTGGLDWRLRDRRALRFEFHDIVRPHRRFTSHYWAIRVGTTFG